MGTGQYKINRRLGSHDIFEASRKDEKDLIRAHLVDDPKKAQEQKAALGFISNLQQSDFLIGSLDVDAAKIDFSVLSDEAALPDLKAQKRNNSPAVLLVQPRMKLSIRAFEIMQIIKNYVKGLLIIQESNLKVDSLGLEYIWFCLDGTIRLSPLCIAIHQSLNSLKEEYIVSWLVSTTLQLALLSDDPIPSTKFGSSLRVIRERSGRHLGDLLQSMTQHSFASLQQLAQYLDGLEYFDPLNHFYIPYKEPHYNRWKNNVQLDYTHQLALKVVPLHKPDHIGVVIPKNKVDQPIVAVIELIEGNIFAQQDLVANSMCSIDKDYLAIGTDDGPVYIWNWRINDLQRAFDYTPYKEAADDKLSVACSLQKPGFIATYSSKKSVIIWNWKTGTLISKFKNFSGFATTLIPLHAKNLIAFGGRQHDIVIANWQVPRGGELSRIRCGLYPAAIALLDQVPLIASACYEGGVQIMNWKNGNLLRFIHSPERMGGTQRLHFMRGTRRVVNYAGQKNVWVFDWLNGKQEALWSYGDRGPDFVPVLGTFIFVIGVYDLDKKSRIFLSIYEDNKL
eukprot:TRINITY_DN5175_c0_g1_i4.p1 TRINITY_DN5175_c0_g1~~TRINITY_DN5175_c0_g1_i4.p1  ORF type:complete len:564 (+),score=48.31 TRINITY_DN5175_c0_g1_i4:253-1944(+)